MSLKNLHRLKKWIIVFILLMPMASSFGFQQSPDEARLVQLTEALLTAFQGEDIEALKSLWSEHSPYFLPVTHSLKATLRNDEKPSVVDFVVRELKVNGDKATVRIITKVKVTPAKPGNGSPPAREIGLALHCVREQADWKAFLLVSSESDLASDLSMATTEAERQGLLDATKELLTANLSKALLQEGNQLTARASHQQAMSTYQLAVRIAEQVNDPESKINGLRFIGRALFYLSDYAGALRWYNESLALATDLRNTPAIVRALNNIGLTHQARGDYDQALVYYEKAFKQAEESDDKLAVANLTAHIGLVHQSRGDFSKSMEWYQRALTTAEQIPDKELVGTALNRIGSVHFWQGDYARALDCYNKSLALATEANDKQGIASVLTNIAGVYWRRGDYQDALANYQRSLALAKEMGNRATIALGLYNIGGIYRAQGKFVQALGQLQSSLELGKELGDKKQQALALNGIGSIYHDQGGHAQALEYFQKSLKVAEDLGDKVLIATFLSNIGNAQYDEGQYQQALLFFKRGLSLAQQTGNRAEMPEKLYNVGKCYWRLGDASEAVAYAQSSLKLAEELGEKGAAGEALALLAEQHLSERKYADASNLADRAVKLTDGKNDPELSSHARFISGLAYRGLNQLDEAVRRFTEAIDMIENTSRQVVGAEIERQQFFENRLLPFHAMTDLLVSRNELAAALTYAERAKARVLLDVLQRGRMSVTKEMTDQEQRREQNLISQITLLNSQIYHEQARPHADEKHRATLEADLRRVRLEYEAFQTTLYASHPQLMAQRGELQPLRLEQFSDLIADDKTALLEFVVMQRKTLLFVLSKDGGRLDLRCFTINLAEGELTNLAQRFSTRLASRSLRVEEAGSQLYAQLLQEAWPVIGNKTKLVIVPDGALWEIPFQALPLAPNKYLIETHTISYAPSLAALREMMNNHAQRQRANLVRPSLLAIGNPVVGEQAMRASRPTLSDQTLERLPETDRQIRILGQLYGTARSRVYTGPTATEEHLKQQAERYDILHLATHGILNNANPLYSQLVLSMPQGNSREDGLLEAWEIIRLDLKMDLAVLSACETARGRVGPGEGVIGLAWAFFVAGTPTVVVSQWKVESQSATDFMVEFHRNLLRNRDRSKLKPGSAPRLTSQNDKAEALRQAALTMIKGRRFAHPFYWAAFVLIGAPD